MTDLLHPETSGEIATSAADTAVIYRPPVDETLRLIYRGGEGSNRGGEGGSFDVMRLPHAPMIPFSDLDDRPYPPVPPPVPPKPSWAQSGSAGEFPVLARRSVPYVLPAGHEWSGPQHLRPAPAWTRWAIAVGALLALSSVLTLIVLAVYA